MGRFIAGLTILGLFALAVIGWIMNIVQVFQWVGDLSGKFIAKSIGILVAPLGAVLGWIG